MFGAIMQVIESCGDIIYRGWNFSVVMDTNIKAYRLYAKPQADSYWQDIGPLTGELEYMTGVVLGHMAKLTDKEIID
jgi:hypothetical protein